MKTVWIFVNGILCRPGDASGWNGRAVTWTHLHLAAGHVAEKFEYLAFALTRRLWQERWANALARLIRKYFGHVVNLVGHSNGCDLIVRALAKIDGQQLGELHLIAPACDADFRRNGLNEALENGQIDSAHVYLSGRDRAMLWALASRAFACLGLGYGTLGLTGPLFTTWPARATLYQHLMEEYGHSDWFAGDAFENTMRRLTAGREES